jgi:aminopeptidase N
MEAAMPAMPEPTHYAIRIEPDLETFGFRGRVDIQLEAAADIAAVELNLQELAIWQCQCRRNGRWQPCGFSVSPEAQTLTVHLPEPMSGALTLRIAYEGIINDEMAGFYRSHYVIDGQRQPIAVTQFQESSARRAFPCLDQPGSKAVFQLEILADDRLEVISNTEPEAETDAGGGRRRVVFASTPRMSTYLVFFAVGRFGWVKQQPTMPGSGWPFRRGWPIPPSWPAISAGGLCNTARTYYDIPYPLSKMDLIAVPDFAFGAMENWGAITFRENLLLQFPGQTSKEGDPADLRGDRPRGRPPVVRQPGNARKVALTCGSTRVSPPISATAWWPTTIPTGGSGISSWSPRPPRR